MTGNEGMCSLALLSVGYFTVVTFECAEGYAGAAAEGTCLGDGTFQLDPATLDCTRTILLFIHITVQDNISLITPICVN